MSASEKERAPSVGRGPTDGIDQAGELTSSQNKSAHGRSQTTKPKSTNVVATIQKTLRSQLRISIMSWRGAHKVELRETTAVISGTYFPTGTFVAVDVSRLGELIIALREAEIEARRRGLLPSNKEGGAP